MTESAVSSSSQLTLRELVGLARTQPRERSALIDSLVPVARVYAQGLAATNFPEDPEAAADLLAELFVCLIQRTNCFCASKRDDSSYSRVISGYLRLDAYSIVGRMKQKAQQELATDRLDCDEEEAVLETQSVPYLCTDIRALQEQLEVDDLLAAFIDTLNGEDDRIARYWLCSGQPRTFKEVAEALELPYNHIRKRIYKIREAFLSRYPELATSLLPSHRAKK